MESNAPKRSDTEFRKFSYTEHQQCVTPLIELPIDLIEDFPVGDSLHLLDHGVTKRLLTGWIEGTLGNIDAKWSKQQLKAVSEQLGSLKAPAEIREQRQVRDFDSIKYWKAVEFRHFALYYGIVVLKGHLPEYIYNHFILYFCAYTIFTSKHHLGALFEVGRRCIEFFVEKFKIIYGTAYFTSNIHNLSHLSDDVKKFGPLNTFSTYPFEGKLFKIGRMLHSGNLPLSQVAKRLIEIDSLDIPSLQDRILKPILKQQIFDRDPDMISLLSNVDYSLYSSLECKKFRINCKRDEDKWVITQTKQIFKVKYIVSLTNGNIMIYGHFLKQLKDFFKLPISSSHLLIFLCENLLDETPPVLISFNDLRCKMFKIDLPRRINNDESDSDDEHVSPELTEAVFLPILKTL